MKVKKARGPDRISNVALKTVFQEYRDTFRKVQKLLLPQKPGDPTSYRPICLLDTVWKRLERIILYGLSQATESEHALSNMQFGFRIGRSTVDAIRTVVEQKRTVNRYCAVVMIVDSRYIKCRFRATSRTGC